MWLKRNKIRCSGIEFPGCYNTGHAPTAVHQYWPGLLDPPDVYMVGCELDVREPAVRCRAYDKVRAGGYIVKGKHTLTGRPLYVYTSSRSARKRYEALCEKALADRNREIEKIRALQAKRRAGDFKATLELGLDYGM